VIPPIDVWPIFANVPLSAALFERFQAALVRPGQRDRQALRKQIIAGVASGHFNLVGLAAQANNIVSQNNFSFCHTKW